MADHIPTQETALVVWFALHACCRVALLPRYLIPYSHDQLEIQSQRAGETTWTTIAYDTSSPYLDARPPLVDGQPESRRYRARYRDDDDPVGEWSDTVEVTAQG